MTTLVSEHTLPYMDPSAATERLRPRRSVFGLGSPVLSSPHVIPSESDGRVSRILEGVIQEKESNKEKCLRNKWDRYDPSLIGGDVGNVVFSGLQVAQIIKPSLAASAGFSMASCILGVLGGALNIGVGVYCLKQAYQARKDLSEESKKILQDKGLLGSAWLVLKGKAPEDLEKYIRLGWDGIFLIAIGAFMVLVSLAIKVGALAGFGAFLAAHPWILPLLWFLITIPLFLEVAKGNWNIFTSKDLSAQLQLKRLKELLENKDGADWIAIEQLYEAEENIFNTQEAERLHQAGRDEEAAEYMSEKMQALQVNMGPEAAIEAMKLKHMIMMKDEAAAIKQIEVLQGKIGSWNRAQKWRLLQQVLLVGSFILSMVGLIPKVNPKTINIATNAVIGLGNFIALVMDIFWPFKRNVYMVVPKAEASAVMERVDGVANRSAPAFSQMLAARRDELLSGHSVHEPVHTGVPTFSQMLAARRDEPGHDVHVGHAKVPTLSEIMAATRTAEYV